MRQQLQTIGLGAIAALLAGAVAPRPTALTLLPVPKDKAPRQWGYHPHRIQLPAADNPDDPSEGIPALEAADGRIYIRDDEGTMRRMSPKAMTRKRIRSARVCAREFHKSQERKALGIILPPGHWDRSAAV